MLRFVNICLVLGLVALACVIYQVKYEARAFDERIAVLHKEIEKERDSLAVARAEWSLLNRPERIERLAKKFLSLEPSSAQQLVILDEVTEQDLARQPKPETATPKSVATKNLMPTAAAPVAAAPAGAPPVGAAPNTAPVSAVPIGDVLGPTALKTR